MKKILIVEDEKLIRDELGELLEKEGYKVIKISDFSDLEAQILSINYDLLLLDLNLPDKSGFQICRDLKGKSNLPILILTSRDGVEDEIKALRLGADEYLTKPFRKDRLLARIENLLKRYEGRENLIEGKGLLLDKNTYTIYFSGTSKVLSQNSGKLLEALLKNQDKLVTKDELSDILWGTNEFIDENALQVNITRLKKTMKALSLPYRVRSVRGKGYVLEERGES